MPGGSVVAAVALSFDTFARALALELAPTRVNVVSPGWVDTPMWDDIVGEAKVGHSSRAWPPPAGGTHRDAGRHRGAPMSILMESEFTTGETIHIDGGQRLI